MQAPTLDRELENASVLVAKVPFPPFTLSLGATGIASDAAIVRVDVCTAPFTRQSLVSSSSRVRASDVCGAFPPSIDNTIEHGGGTAAASDSHGGMLDHWRRGLGRQGVSGCC